MVHMVLPNHSILALQDEDSRCEYFLHIGYGASSRHAHHSKCAQLESLPIENAWLVAGLYLIPLHPSHLERYPFAGTPTPMGLRRCLVA